MLAAAFFVASLIHVPIGPSNVHLILNGIVGLLLGWAAFPAILIALVLQAMLFQYGGISTLGVNTIIMALPAVTCGLLLGRAAADAFRLGFHGGIFNWCPLGFIGWPSGSPGIGFYRRRFFEGGNRDCGSPYSGDDH